MPNHNSESDADLERNRVDGPTENPADPTGAPEASATENGTPLADPDGGATADGPETSETEQVGAPGDEPAAEGAGETTPMDEAPPAEETEEGHTAAASVAAAGAAGDEPADTDSEEEGTGGDEVPPIEATEEGLVAATTVAAAGAAGDEPVATDLEEEGAGEDEAPPTEATEEGLAAATTVAAAGAVVGPAAADLEEEVTGGDEAAPTEVTEEGLAAAATVAAAGAVVGPAAADLEEEGATEDEAAPTEVTEEGLAAAATVAAAGAVVGPAPADLEEEGATEDEAAPAEVTEEGLAAAAVAADHEAAAALALRDKKRRRLLAGLLVLIALLIAAGVLFGRYLLKPGPLPDLLPLPVDVNYRPHYLFSIYGVERPVGVAVSPDGERIYVTETGGEREVKAFDRDGRLLRSFSPPYTGPAERAPVYVAVDPTGRVFVTDRLQRAVFVYDRDGNLLDAILGPDLTLSEYVSKHADDLQPDSMLAYNLFGRSVRFQNAGEREQVLPAPDPADWAPLGVRVDERGTMLLTDVVEGQHAVREFPGDLILAATWQEFDPPEIVFGAQGHDSGEFMYPNSAVADSEGRIYVTDGNNGRISVWDALGSFLFNFGRGVGDSGLSLPRGAAMDKRDRLHIVDAVDQSVKVYDVSEAEPRFLFAFGDWGTEEGEFNYPGDIALDGTGRLYVADRENNRIQVWSY